jgi:hypothetical protein
MVGARVYDCVCAPTRLDGRECKCECVHGCVYMQLQGWMSG